MSCRIVCCRVSARAGAATGLSSTGDVQELHELQELGPAVGVELVSAQFRLDRRTATVSRGNWRYADGAGRGCGCGETARGCGCGETARGSGCGEIGRSCAAGDKSSAGECVDGERDGGGGRIVLLDGDRCTLDSRRSPLTTPSRPQPRPEALRVTVGLSVCPSEKCTLLVDRVAWLETVPYLCLKDGYSRCAKSISSAGMCPKSASVIRFLPSALISMPTHSLRSRRFRQTNQ